MSEPDEPARVYTISPAARGHGYSNAAADFGDEDAGARANDSGASSSPHGHAVEPADGGTHFDVVNLLDSVERHGSALRARSISRRATSVVLPSPDPIPVTSAGSSWQASSLIIMNAALGAGVLNLPDAFNRAGGVLVGMSVQIVVVALAFVGIVVLGFTADKASENQPVDSYQTVTRRLCGKWAGALCSLGIFFYTYATCVTFLIIVGDQSDRLLHDKVSADFCHYWYMQRWFTVTAASCALILPLCFFKNIDSLKKASAAAMLSVFYLIALTVFDYVSYDRKETVIVKTGPTVWTDVFVAIPVLAFGYQCHVSSVPVYACVRPRDVRSFAKAVASAFAVCFVAYSAIGACGFLRYGVDVQSDLLSSMSTDQVWYVIGYIAFAIKTCLTYPIVAFCGRLALQSLLSEVGIRSDNAIGYVVLPLVWFTSSLLMAHLLPTMGPVVSFLGFVCTFFIFVFPGMGLIVIASEWMNDDGSMSAKECGGALLGALLLVMGAFLAGMTLVQTFQYTEVDVEPLCK